MGTSKRGATSFCPAALRFTESASFSDALAGFTLSPGELELEGGLVGDVGALLRLDGEDEGALLSRGQGGRGALGAERVEGRGIHLRGARELRRGEQGDHQGQERLLHGCGPPEGELHCAPTPGHGVQLQMRRRAARTTAGQAGAGRQCEALGCSGAQPAARRCTAHRSPGFPRAPAQPGAAAARVRPMRRHCGWLPRAPAASGAPQVEVTARCCATRASARSMRTLARSTPVASSRAQRLGELLTSKTLGTPWCPACRPRRPPGPPAARSSPRPAARAGVSGITCGSGPPC